MLCIIYVFSLCCVQILGNSLLILACLCIYLLFVGWSCFGCFSFPVLLFFLPWSALLKNGVGSNSFYTFAMILVCLICIINKKFKYNATQIIIGICFLSITIISKMLNDGSIDNSFLLFIFLFFLFPIMKEELQYLGYNYHDCVIFFSVGIIIAALSARFLIFYPNIARYITVDSFRNITRFSGFYGDPNFYAAHITAAISGCYVLVQNANKRKELFELFVVIGILAYCGMLSGSKSFVLVLGTISVIWIIELLFLRKKNIVMIWSMLGIGLFIVYRLLITGEYDLIDIMNTRFSNIDTMSSFTTGRSELWINYLKEFSQNIKVVILGNGFTNVLINGRASHNTIIQIIYQIGIIGGILIAIWIYCFLKQYNSVLSMSRKNLANVLIVYVGIFSPWMALDMLLADEFFLMMLYAYASIRYLRAHS